MALKKPKNLHKIGEWRLQKDSSSRKLDGIEDAINDWLKT